MKNLILLKNNLIQVSKSDSSSSILDNSLLVTLISNIAHYGYMLSKDVIDSLSSYSKEELIIFWKSLKDDLEVITGNDRKMDDFVVYKNFPQEVLDKTETEYWISQIFMYLGVPNEYFTEDAKEREPLFEQKSLKVLHLSSDPNKDLIKIFNNLCLSGANWSDEETSDVLYLFDELSLNLNMKDFNSKENAINLFVYAFNQNSNFNLDINDATDVLRFASALSGQDISLRDYSFKRNFKRFERKTLLNLLENSKNLIADIAMRKAEWKSFFRKVRVGDYKNKYPKCVEALDLLYNNKIKSTESSIQNLIDILSTNLKNISEHKSFNESEKNVTNNVFKNALKDLKINKEDINPINEQKLELFNLLKLNPGLFVRKFHKVYSIDQKLSVSSFLEVINKIDTKKLLTFKKYLQTINSRKELMYTPLGNWNHVILAKNIKLKIKKDDLVALIESIENTISKRINHVLQSNVFLDEKLKDVKIQTNGQDMSAYGRGTKIDIPANIKFVRSASYWSTIDKNYDIWFDNGWNFFDTNWSSLGACCWDKPYYAGNCVSNSNEKAAIFSGDPTNSKDLKGRACQMIDLNLDVLKQSGVRYAVWNILSYSNIKFNNADDLLATIQWGEKPEQGELYEPSRAQVVHKLQGNSLVKYLICLDLEENKLIYMDANLRGSIHSANNNSARLSETLPAYFEYLDSLPSMYDLFENNQGGDIPVVFSDKDLKIEGKAIVINPENESNVIDDISIEYILNT